MNLVKILFTPNTSFLNSFYDKARFILAWRVSVVFFLMFCLLFSIYLFVGVSTSQYLMVLLVLFITGGSVFYLKFFRKFELLFWIYAIAGTLISNLAMNLVLDFTHYVDFLWIICSVLIAFVGLGQKKGLYLLLINVLFIGYFLFFTLNKHIIVLEPKTTIELIGDYIEIITALYVFTYLLYQYFIFNDYLRLKLLDANQELEKQNNEKKILVKEVHHRVKNNLQIIISLLRMQKNENEDSAQENFDEAINRIMSMALIHKKLYQEKDLSELELKPYILDLSNEIKNVFNSSDRYKIRVNSSKKMIGLKTIVPLGLLVNELLSNTFKHSIQPDNQFEIIIDVDELTNGIFTLRYNDFGEWKISDDKKSFGLELIETLTEQLEGTVERDGSSYLFKLKDLDL